MRPLTRTRPRTRRLAPRPSRVVLVGVITSLVIGGFIWIALNAYSGVPGIDYRTLYVSLPNIGHLKQHDPVDIAGVRVGQVLHTSTRDNRALVELQLRGVGPLPQDTRAVVRAQGLLGARYVDLEPGESRKVLPDGATIVQGAGTYTEGVPETLDLFDPATRAALGKMTRGLGEGLLGRGSQLNETMRVGPDSGHDFDTAVDAILGRGDAASRLLPASKRGFDALSTAREDFAGMLGPAAETAQAFADERRAVGEVPGRLNKFFRTSANVTVGTYANELGGLRVFDALGELAKAGDKVLPRVPSGLRATARLLEGSAEPLRRTLPAFDEARRAVDPTLRILAALRPDLAPLRDIFERLQDPVATLARHGCDLQSFVTGTRSMVSYGTVPGGNWGPDVGFPLTIIAGPQQGNPIANTGFTFPDKNAYHEPCEYNPGVTITSSLVFEGTGK